MQMNEKTMKRARHQRLEVLSAPAAYAESEEKQRNHCYRKPSLSREFFLGLFALAAANFIHAQTFDFDNLDAPSHLIGGPGRGQGGAAQAFAAGEGGEITGITVGLAREGSPGGQLVATIWDVDDQSGNPGKLLHILGEVPINSLPVSENRNVPNVTDYITIEGSVSGLTPNTYYYLFLEHSEDANLGPNSSWIILGSEEPDGAPILIADGGGRSWVALEPFRLHVRIEGAVVAPNLPFRGRAPSLARPNQTSLRLTQGTYVSWSSEAQDWVLETAETLDGQWGEAVGVTETIAGTSTHFLYGKKRFYRLVPREVEYHFTGTVESSNASIRYRSLQDPIPGIPVEAGTPIEGSFTLNPRSRPSIIPALGPPSQAAPTQFMGYRRAVADFSLKVDGEEILPPNLFSITTQLVNDARRQTDVANPLIAHVSSPSDSLTLSTPISGTDLGQADGHIVLNLTDTTGSVFHDERYPSEWPYGLSHPRYIDTERFDVRKGFISELSPDQTRLPISGIMFNIDSLEPTEAYLPPSFEFSTGRYVSWPSDAEGVALETAETPTGAWRFYDEEIFNVNDQHYVMIDSDRTSAFFRLVRED